MDGGEGDLIANRLDLRDTPLFDQIRDDASGDARRRFLAELRDQMNQPVRETMDRGVARVSFGLMHACQYPLFPFSNLLRLATTDAG
jgi:hypothetical protein